MCPRLSYWGEWKTVRVVAKKGVERGQKYKGKREPPELPSVMRRGLGAILSPRSATRHTIQPCLSSLPCGEAHICPLKLTLQETKKPWERTSLATGCFSFLNDYKKKDAREESKQVWFVLTNLTPVQKHAISVLLLLSVSSREHSSSKTCLMLRGDRNSDHLQTGLL